MWVMVRLWLYLHLDCGFVLDDTALSCQAIYFEEGLFFVVCFFNVSLGKLGRDGLEVELTGFIDRLKGGGEGKREQPRANLICGQATGWLTSLLAKTGKAVDRASWGQLKR